MFARYVVLCTLQKTSYVKQKDFCRHTLCAVVCLDSLLVSLCLHFSMYQFKHLYILSNAKCFLTAVLHQKLDLDEITAVPTGYR